VVGGDGPGPALGVRAGDGGLRRVARGCAVADRRHVHLAAADHHLGGRGRGHRPGPGSVAGPVDLVGPGHHAAGGDPGAGPAPAAGGGQGHRARGTTARDDDRGLAGGPIPAPRDQEADAMLSDLSLPELREYRPEVAEPADFDEFWAGELAVARAQPGEASFVPAAGEVRHAQVFDVTFPGYGGQPVRAWLLVPRQLAPRPAMVVEYVGYGGGRGTPFDWLTWSCAGH